jgi:hypothetical protein
MHRISLVLEQRRSELTTTDMLCMHAIIEGPHTTYTQCCVRAVHHVVLLRHLLLVLIFNINIDVQLVSATLCDIKTVNHRMCVNGCCILVTALCSCCGCSNSYSFSYGGGSCPQCVIPAASNAVNPTYVAGVATYSWTCNAGAHRVV